MATEMRNDDSGMTAASVRQFKKIIDNRIAKSVPKPVRSRKAVVKRIDTNGTVWADIIGGEGSTPIEVVTTTTVPGDVIDVHIQDGKAYGSAASENPTVTTSYLGEVLQMMASASKGDTVVFDGTVLQVDNVLAGTIQAMEGSFSELRSEIARINKLEVHDFKAVNAQIVDLSADTAKIHSLTAEELSAATAYIADLESENISVSDLAADHAAVGSLDANYASIGDLNAATARIGGIEADYLTASDMTAEQARVGTLLADYAHITNGAIDNATIGYANVDDLDAHYAQIDFANVISQQTAYAVIQDLLAASGWFEQLVTPSGTITGELTAVKIDANDVEIDNLKVSNLYLLNDEDGLYYALNVTLGGTTAAQYAALTPEKQAELQSGLHGENIIAGTITADKIYVTDLAAFNATIAGMVFGTVMIGGTNYYTMHTFGKNAVTSATPGMYTDSMGQFSVGSATDYLTFYKDQNGNWKLAIAANQISMGGSTLSSQLDALQAQVDNVVETWFGSGAPSSSTAPESNWTTAGQKNAHLGDVYYDNDTGRAYRYTLSNNVYSWISIPDSAVVAALDAIDGVTDDVTALSEAVDSTIIFKVTEEYSQDESSVTLTAHVYRGGEDIATSFEDTDFAWFRKNEDGSPLVPLPSPYTNGRVVQVQRSSVGYGAAIVCRFTEPNDSVLLDSDDDALTDSEGTPIAARTPSGDYVRVADLEATTTVFDTDKLMLVGAEEEQLVTIATLKDVFGDGDYERLDNMPSIEDVTLVGNRTFPDLGIFKTDSQGYPVADDYTLTTLDINSLWANAQPIGA